MTMENESSISLGWGQNFQTPTAVKKPVQPHLLHGKLDGEGGRFQFGR